MKIQICGYSGSGKSTFARKLGEMYKIKVLHLDSIHFSEGWMERSDIDMSVDVMRFMKQEDWIIDGNYTRIAPKRYEECDQLFYFNFNRIACLINVIRRYRKYRHTTRDDMASGCEEKLDFEFVKWVLLDGRKRKQRLRKKKYQELYQDKIVVFENQKQVDLYFKNLITAKKGGNPNDYSNCI